MRRVVSSLPETIIMTDPKYPTIQSFPWPASIAAVKASENFDSFPEFHQHLLAELPVNSPETRRRYVNTIERRFFSGRALDSLASMVWRSYHNESLLLDIMRVIALEAEPAAADFVVNHILTQAPGSLLQKEAIEVFVVEAYDEFKRDTYDRLRIICRDLGFLGRYNGDLLVQKIPPAGDALLILLHDRLAPAPRIVRLSEILEAPWWRYLGLREAGEVRAVLRQAENAGLIARYSRVDELEQVTTRYSRDEYLQGGKRL